MAGERENSMFIFYDVIRYRHGSAKVLGKKLRSRMAECRK